VPVKREFAQKFGGCVKHWKIVLISTLITLAIGGLYLLSVWRHRRDPGVIGKQNAEQAETMDDVAIVRMEFQQHFEDMKDLQGKSVWMKNGYTMSYFPYASGKVDFHKRVGVVPAAQRLDVKKVIKASVPDDVDDGLEHGSRQAMVVFELPGKEGQFATPVGFLQGNQETYYCDLLFFYDDPHTIYSHWSKDTWAAVDAHQVKPGMNELQTRMAVGQKMRPDSQNEGNRTVTYDQDGNIWKVRFVKDRATEVKNG
jgi:hypothetical protein